MASSYHQSFVKIEPKGLYYHGDGTGRDGYVLRTNGGLVSNEMYEKLKPVSRNSYGVGHFGAYQQKQQSQFTKAKVSHYQPDGSGRDTYVSINEGGSTVNYNQAKKQEHIFHSMLRGSAQPSSTKASNNPHILGPFGYRNPKANQEFRQIHIQQVQQAHRLSQNKPILQPQRRCFTPNSQSYRSLNKLSISNNNNNFNHSSSNMNFQTGNYMSQNPQIQRYDPKTSDKEYLNLRIQSANLHKNSKALALGGKLEFRPSFRGEPQIPKNLKSIHMQNHDALSEKKRQKTVPFFESNTRNGSILENNENYQNNLQNKDIKRVQSAMLTQKNKIQFQQQQQQENQNNINENSKKQIENQQQQKLPNKNFKQLSRKQQEEAYRKDWTNKVFKTQHSFEQGVDPQTNNFMNNEGIYY